MTTYRVKHSKENPYVKLDKGFLHSKDLSAKAKGILAYLLSLPSDWRICLSHLVKVFSDGEASIRSGLGELKKAGYLTKVAVRDQRGQIVSWVTDVYETPHHIDRDSDKNGNFFFVKSSISCDENSSPDVDNLHLDNPQLNIPQVNSPPLENPHLENRSQLIKKDPLMNDLTNPPLPSQVGGTDEKELKIPFSERSISVTAIEQLDSSNLFLVQKDASEESSSAAVSKNDDNVTKCEVIPGASFEVTSLTVSKPRTRLYDRALGIESPENWKNLQQKQIDWVPDGPWLHSGKLDPNFVDWLAIDWQKQYGGTIHKKRSDVLRHFKKDPANIAIAWEQYRAEHLHRYENAALRMHNGLEIKPDEQQQLLTHARAVTNPLPDELNPVASVGKLPRPLSSVSMSPPETALIEEASRVGLAHVCESASAHENVVSGENQLNAQLETKENNFFPIRPSACGEQDNNSYAFSTNDDGSPENPGAYKEWFPKPIEDEPISPQQWLEKLAAFTQELSMSKNQPEPQKSMESSDELEELNQWLCDPILCKEVMARVMRSDRYTVEFDEEGNPYKVVEIEF